jgi:hypothetical protein
LDHGSVRRWRLIGDFPIHLSPTRPCPDSLSVCSVTRVWVCNQNTGHSESRLFSPLFSVASLHAGFHPLALGWLCSSGARQVPRETQALHLRKEGSLPEPAAPGQPAASCAWAVRAARPPSSGRPRRRRRRRSAGEHLMQHRV